MPQPAPASCDTPIICTIVFQITKSETKSSFQNILYFADIEYTHNYVTLFVQYEYVDYFKTLSGLRPTMSVVCVLIWRLKIERGADEWTVKNV